MATFLPPAKILSELTTLIEDAQEQVILISPHLVLLKKIQDIITETSRKVPFTFVLGNVEDIDGEIRVFYRRLEHSRLYSQRDLHATCYLNEERAILTSMNLLDDACKNRYDLGVLIDGEYDTEIFRDLCREVERIIRCSTEVDRAAFPERITRFSEQEMKGEKPPLPGQGFCIRCGTTIPYDREKPFCHSCFIEWDSQGGNPYYKQKYCHQCRNPVSSSYEKPLCPQCARTTSR